MSACTRRCRNTTCSLAVTPLLLFFWFWAPLLSLPPRVWVVLCCDVCGRVNPGLHRCSWNSMQHRSGLALGRVVVSVSVSEGVSEGWGGRERWKERVVAGVAGPVGDDVETNLRARR